MVKSTYLFVKGCGEFMEDIAEGEYVWIHLFANGLLVRSDTLKSMGHNASTYRSWGSKSFIIRACQTITIAEIDIHRTTEFKGIF